MGSTISVAEVLEKVREKWNECPSEEHYVSWWYDVGDSCCALCDYIYMKFRDKKIKEHLSGFSCQICPIWGNNKGGVCNKYYNKMYHNMLRSVSNYKIFAENFNSMREVIFNLTVDDFKHLEEENA